MLGVEGEDSYPLTCTNLISYAGGTFVGPYATVGTFENTDDTDVNFFGKGLAKFTKNGSGILFVDQNAVVAQLINNGTGDIIVDGKLTDVSTNPSLLNVENTTITINGKAETVETTGDQTFTVGPGATIATLNTSGSGAILVQGANVDIINNNGSAAIDVTEGVKNSVAYLPTVVTINNGENGGAVNVTANQSSLEINNKSKTADIVVDFANSENIPATWTATITDNSGFITSASTGGMTVKNTSGLVTLSNVGGAVEMDNCPNDNFIDNDTQTDATITLTNSYAATLTNKNSNDATVYTSGKAGIGTLTGGFKFVDAAWDGSALESRIVSGNIYTAAQLAALTQYSTTESTITLKTNIDLGNHKYTWAGIQQGAMTTFEGNKFTISNLNLIRPVTDETPVLSGKDKDRIGLFASAGTNNLTIQNLTLNNFVYKSFNKNCVGALVGEFNGSTTKSLFVKNVTVSNVNFDSGNSSTQSNSIAAFVGKFVGDKLTFDGTNISGTSTIKGTSSLAGFVGNLGNSNDVEFKGSTLAGLTIIVRGTPAESDATDAVAGRVGYLIGGVSGNVNYLKVYANCDVTPATLTDDQRVAWKYKKRKVNDSKYFWGDAKGYLGYCQGTITEYWIGDNPQTSGDAGTYNIYKGY